VNNYKLSKFLNTSFAIVRLMAKEEKGGLHSSAGLIRYFDSEEKTAIPINPKIVIVGTAIIAVLVMLLPKIFPY